MWESRKSLYLLAASYHPKSYMTESAHKYNTVGGGKGLITNFSGIFGDAFDSTVTEDGERIGA